WGSGEQFWDFDLERRELHLLQAEEGGDAPGEDLVLASRMVPLPRVHAHDRLFLRRRLRAHLRGHEPLFTSEHRVDPEGNGNWVW
ncbi:hypothetical protein, partial [Neisseria sp. P0009.S003]